jgi:hypothetical protein
MNIGPKCKLLFYQVKNDTELIMHTRYFSTVRYEIYLLFKLAILLIFYHLKMYSQLFLSLEIFIFSETAVTLVYFIVTRIKNIHKSLFEVIFFISTTNKFNKTKFNIYLCGYINSFCKSIGFKK